MLIFYQTTTTLGMMKAGRLILSVCNVHMTPGPGVCGHRVSRAVLHPDAQLPLSLPQRRAEHAATGHILFN